MQVGKILYQDNEVKLIIKGSEVHLEFMSDDAKRNHFFGYAHPTMQDYLYANHRTAYWTLKDYYISLSKLK